MADTSYKQPESVPVPKISGYPNDVKNTQTLKMRGVYAVQTKGKNTSTKMG
jgi:hypothetical protein